MVKNIITIIKNLPSLITIFKKIYNIIKGWNNKFLKREQDLTNARLPICNKCGFKEKSKIGDKCSICGCYLDAKTRVKDEYCDLGKW